MVTSALCEVFMHARYFTKLTRISFVTISFNLINFILLTEMELIFAFTVKHQM